MKHTTKEFQELVEMCQSTYIGQGNPLSKILILGKECAIDAENNQGKYKQEIANNAYDWLYNSDETHLRRPSEGQKFSKNPDGGTCSTWYYYQKLYNLISRREQSEGVDFFNNCFISELSSATGLNSKSVKEEYRRKSIAKRIEIFKTAFFQQFPIVIVAAGHYCRDYNIDIEQIFGVKWIAPTIDIGGKWVNIHYSTDFKLPKLLIHTNQLSIVSNELLEKIAEICIEFIEKNNIDL